MTQNIDRFLSAFNTYLKDFNVPIPPKPSYPLIFILGMSRSGTTLLYQTLVKHLRLGYPNNLIARFWSNPCVGIFLSRSILGSHKSISFQSSFGNTPTITDPHEFGHFWKHWFDFRSDSADVLSAEQLSRIDWAGLARVLRDMTRCFGLPVLFKQLALSFQAHRLSIELPESRFIYIYRPSYEIASSILKTRRERHGSDAFWFGLKPPKWQRLLDLPPLEQIRKQVDVCTGLIREQIETIKADQLYTIDFNDLKKHPMSSVQKVKAKFRLHYDLSDQVHDRNSASYFDCRISEKEIAFFSKNLQEDRDRPLFFHH